MTTVQTLDEVILTKKSITVPGFLSLLSSFYNRESYRTFNMFNVQRTGR